MTLTYLELTLTYLELTLTYLELTLTYLELTLTYLELTKTYFKGQLGRRRRCIANCFGLLRFFLAEMRSLNRSRRKPYRKQRRREAIEGDDADVPQRRGAAEDVRQKPDVAHRPPEDPVSETLVDGRQRKDDDAQQEVADGEVADEVVGDGAQLAVAEQRQPDEEVADRGRHDDDEEDDADGDHRRSAVVERKW